MTATSLTNTQIAAQILFANDQIPVSETGTAFATSGAATETVIDGAVTAITDFTISFAGSFDGAPEESGIPSLVVGTTGVVRNIGANLGAVYLIGKGGKDRMTGGARANRFDCDDLGESGTTGTTMETVYDSGPAADKINLFDIDADALTTGELRDQYIGSNAMLDLDVDGDSVADFNILLAGNISFSAEGFTM